MFASRADLSYQSRDPYGAPNTDLLSSLIKARHSTVDLLVLTSLDKLLLIMQTLFTFYKTS
jgi:hypothetical protein